MKRYRIYDAVHGRTEEHGYVEAESAADALREGLGQFDGGLHSPIETNKADDSAWQEYPDHSDRSDQSEHLYCADAVLCDDN